MGWKDRLEKKTAQVVAAAQDSQLLARATESVQAATVSAGVYRAGSHFRSLRALFDEGDRPTSAEGFLLRLIQAVRNDERATERSARQLYVAARKRRRRLGMLAFGAGPLVGVANQVADLYCEIATVCDVAAFHDMNLTDEQIAAHMLVLWSVTDTLEKAGRAVAGDPPVATMLAKGLLDRVSEQLPENPTKRELVKSLWAVRGSVADAGRASTSESLRTVVFTGHRTKQVIKRAEAQLGTQGIEVDDDLDPGTEEAQATLAEFELTGDEHALLAAFSGAQAALARTDPSSSAYLEALETTAEAFFAHFRHTGNFATLDGSAVVFGRAAAIGDRDELPRQITVRHDDWPGAVVTRATSDPCWTIEHPDGQLSHISKDWSGWTGEDWPTGFTIERPDGSSFPVDESHFGDGWQLVELVYGAGRVDDGSVTPAASPPAPASGSVPRAKEPAATASIAAPRFFDRVVPFPNLDNADFIYVETVRELGRAQRIDDFAATETLGATLMAANDGYGFGGVVRDSLERPVTPIWLSATCVAIDGSHLAVGATVSHLALEHRSTALDLGARDGRNAIGWSGEGPEGLPMPNANLFLGDIQEQWLEMSEAGGNVGSIDISPDGRQVVQSEWWAGIGALVTVDTSTGQRTVLGTLANLGGGERVRFSPDGKFILVTRWADPVLVDAASGEVVTLPLNGDIGWWPSRDSTTLIWLDQREEGHGMIRSFDLSTGATEAVRPIQYPVASGLGLSRYRLNYPEVDETGTKVLCGTYFGVRPELQEEHGSRERVSLLDIETGVVEPLVSPHVGGDERLEREHHSWRWLRRTPASSSVALAPGIVATTVPASYGLVPQNYESAADQARNLTVACMRAMVGDSPDRGVPLFAPEVLRALGAIQTFAPDSLAELESWLAEVSEKMPIFAPPGQNQVRWTWFRDGWRSIKSGSTTGIAWRRFSFASTAVEQTEMGDGTDESAPGDERSGHAMAEVYVCIPIGESEAPADVAMFEPAAGRLAAELSNGVPGRTAVLADRDLVREVSRRLQRDRLEGLASDAEIAQVIARAAPVGVFVTIGVAGDGDTETEDARRVAGSIIDALAQGELGPRLQAHLLTDPTLVSKIADHFG